MLWQKQNYKYKVFMTTAKCGNDDGDDKYNNYGDDDDNEDEDQCLNHCSPSHPFKRPKLLLANN